MADNFTPTPVKGRKSPNTTAPTDDNVGALVAVSSNLLPAYAEGNLVALSTDLTGRLRVALSDPTENGGNGFDVDVTDRAERLLGVVSLDPGTESRDADRIRDLRDALLAALESVDLNVTTRDDIVNRLSTNLESVDLNPATRDDIVARLTAAVVDLRDRLVASLESVDLNAATLTALTTANPYVRGAAVDDGNPLPVVIQENPGRIRDSLLLSQVDVAAGAAANLDSPVVAADRAGRLLEVTSSASVRTRVEIQALDAAGAVTPLRVFFVEANETLVYRVIDAEALVAPAGGRFRIASTNMDNLLAANVYGSISFVER